MFHPIQVFPILKLNNKIVHILHKGEDDEPESNATGFLLECEEGIVLVSAAHVADDETLCVALKENDPNEIYVINGRRFKSLAPKGRMEDKKDWAIFNVNDDILNGLRTLGIKPFRGYIEKKGCPPFQVAGFPITACRNKRHDGKKVIQNKPYQWSGLEASEEIYSIYEYNPEENILIKFGQGIGFYEDAPKEIAKFRSPRGMSGSPITDANGALVGIFTGVTKDNEYLIGTRIKVMVDDAANEKFDKVDLD